jgi:hypothetical protein
MANTIIQIKRSQANTPANLAYGELAYSFATNTLYIGANTGTPISVTDQATANIAREAYSQANAAYSQANAAYVAANVAYNAANTVAVYANGQLLYANAYLNLSNTPNIALIANADLTNTFVDISFDLTPIALGPAYSQANSAYAQANGAYGQANGAYAQANGAYTQANGAYSQANGAYAQANAVYSAVNTTFSTQNTIIASAANTVSVFANGIIVLPNANINFNNTSTVNVVASANGTTQSNIGFTVNVASSDWAAAANAVAQTAYAQANAAYLQANLAENLIFTQTLNAGNTIETLTGYQNSTGSILTVRTAAITGGVFTLNVASFTPIVTATVSPAVSLLWDQGLTSFTAYATNPSDFLSQYLSNVYSITAVTGNVTGTISSFTAGSFNVAPSAGVSWQKTYTLNGTTGFIGPTYLGTTAGGTATANLTYNVHTVSSNTDVQYTGANAQFTVTWSTATPTISITALASNTFLNAYSTTTYTVGTSGVANTGNVVQTITPTGGSVSSTTGSGTLTFTNLVSLANGVSGGISLSTQAKFSRPANVTGTFYQANSTASASLSAPTWTYPSFTMFTPSTATPPVRSNVVNGFSFNGNGNTLTIIGNSVKNFTGNVVNGTAGPEAWWLGVASNATQPTSFLAGTPGLQSSVTPTTGTLTLYPDANSSISQAYSLYGFTVQAGNTYFIIS